jgi:hypothetical protein
MIAYTVIWDETLEANYIDAWTKSDSKTRTALTWIANWLDHALARDPDRKGYERPDIASRVLVVPWAGARVFVIYRVIPEDRKVIVTRLVFRRVP